MTKLHKTTTALLLTATLILSGCAEQRNSPAQGTESTSSGGSSDFSSTTTDSESSIPKGESTSEPPSSPSENSSDNSDITSDPDRSSGGSSDVNSDPIPVEFTEEDLELQHMLEEIYKGESMIECWFRNAEPLSDGITLPEPYICKLYKNDGTEFSSYHSFYLIPKDYSEGGGVIPNTCEGMKAIMMEYCSDSVTDVWMTMVCKGNMTENSDGTFTIILDNNNDYHEFIEIDGRMYRFSDVKVRSFLKHIDCRTAKVVSRTDDTIEFSFITPDWYNLDEDDNPIYLNDVSQYEENAYTGVLKYERGGWRRDWDKT